MGMKKRMERTAQQRKAMVAELATSLKQNCMNHLFKQKLHEFSLEEKWK